MKVSVYLCVAVLILGSHKVVEATGLDQEQYNSDGEQVVFQEGSEGSSESKEDWFWNPFAAKQEALADDDADKALKNDKAENEDTKGREEENSDVEAETQDEAEDEAREEDESEGNHGEVGEAETQDEAEDEAREADESEDEAREENHSEVGEAEAQDEVEDETREADESDDEALEGDQSADNHGEGDKAGTQDEANEENEAESLDEAEAEETDDDSKLADEDELGENASVAFKDEFQTYSGKGKNCKNGERRGLGCYSKKCKVIGGGKCKGLCCQSQLKSKGNRCKKDGPAPCWGLGPKAPGGKGKKGKGGKGPVMCACSSPDDPDDTAFECDNGKGAKCPKGQLCSSEDEFDFTKSSSTCKACEPYSEAACKIAAEAQCLELGGGGFDFAGKYGTKGCYTYKSGKYKGMAYYGTGGTEKDMKKAAKSPKIRIDGDDCGKVTAKQCDCEAYTQAACIAAAEAQCFQLGGGGFDFAGKYGTKGCYTYKSGKFKGMAFYGTGGKSADKKKAAKLPKMRIDGADCEKRLKPKACKANQKPQKWDFAMMSNGDLMGVLKGFVTGSDKTEVHMLKEKNQYQKWALQVPTAFGISVGGSSVVEFVVRPDNGDLVGIMKGPVTGSKKTEVHILKAPNYNKFALQTGTGFSYTAGVGQQWKFLMAWDGDLAGVLRGPVTGSKKTEVHTASAKSNYQKFNLHAATGSAYTDSIGWDFGMKRNRDIVLILKGPVTGSGKTEVHILKAATDYKTYSLHAATALGITTGNLVWDFGIKPSNGDLVGILRGPTTGSGKTEVHICSASTNYKEFALQSKTSMELTVSTTTTTTLKAIQPGTMPPATRPPTPPSITTGGTGGGGLGGAGAGGSGAGAGLGLKPLLHTWDYKTKKGAKTEIYIKSVKFNQQYLGSTGSGLWLKAEKAQWKLRKAKDDTYVTVDDPKGLFGISAKSGHRLQGFADGRIAAATYKSDKNAWSIEAAPGRFQFYLKGKGGYLQAVDLTGGKYKVGKLSKTKDPACIWTFQIVPGTSPTVQPTPAVNPGVRPTPAVNPGVRPPTGGPLVNPPVRPTPTPKPKVDLGAAWFEAANCSSELGGLGTTANLDEFGYLEVAEICCNFQMEFFITRVVISMGYKVCDQSGVMGLVPWFSCGDFQSLTKLKAAIKAGAPSETECPFVQWNNEDCVSLAQKCFSNETKNEGYHRRRVCDKVGGYSGGSPGGQTVSITSYALYAPAPSSSGGGGGGGVYNLGGPARYGGTNYNTINVPGYAGFDFGGYTPLPAPAPPPKMCAATFMNMAGTTVMNTIVQGESDYALDVACCNKCTAEKECTFWVRKSGVAPGTACYLRKLAKGISNSLAYRGGWRKELTCGAKNGCFSSFDYMSGTIVDKVGICGDTPEALDQHCCAKCRQNEDCEFWVREAGESGYRGCQLMKNPGSKSVNILWRGGWKQGCGKFDDCHATFMNRGGSLLDKLGVCGENHIQLDAACCDLCSKDEDCEFWVRDTGSTGSQFCWLYKNAAMAESYSSNRRGGWNKICNDGNGFDQCLATFQNINGATVQTTRVCGKTDAGLDTECCQKCKANNLCESWVRERGSRGFKSCILKRSSTTESAHANYRGGYTTKQSCGDAFLDQNCRASFYDWGGPQVGKVRYVCGKNAAELDAHCCALCRNETTCTFWVRESIGSTAGEGANRPRACWLRRAMGGPSKNLNRRGGFKQGCGKGVTSCKQTFMDRSGAQVDRVAVCAGNSFKTMTQRDQYLDGACCDLCAKNPTCEFWVRDRIPFTEAHGAPNTTYCWLRKNAAINPSNNANRRGGWNRICGNPKFTPCAASFQELHGHVVATHRVCGTSDEQLDAECCDKCKQMKTCDFWVREKGGNGYLWCWLRRKGNGNKSPNANRRGGYKTPMTCGKKFLKNGCKSEFDEMSGSQLKIEFVCGATDLELDAHCCALCRNDTRCEFWVRETRLITDPPTRPKQCWLRWNAGSASKNANRRGGWREGCDKTYPSKCTSTFTDRSGPEVDKRGVCGNGTKAIAMDEYLDSACCDLCAKNPTCEFWVRETTLPARNNTFCYLRKYGAVAETVRTNKRGGWNRICGNPNNPACGAVFQEIHSSAVAQFRVCGKSDAALDAECCSKCKDNNLCEKWVRETGKEGWRWCWLRRAGNNQLRAHGSRRGGWKESGKCGDAYVSNGCKSSFDHIGGAQVGYTFICGKSEDELDAHCCAACRNNTRCEFWVRESGESGIKQCWLRYNPGGHSKHASYRGGWRQGCAGDGVKKCDATFTDWNGGTVDQLGVCGEDNAKMDAACCALCDQNPDCEFWVREDTDKVTKDRKNSALCWLKKTGSTERVATDRRGAWKACTSTVSGDCPATFQEMSGPQVAVSRVCGDDEAKLDAACCANCAKNPACMFWVRESGDAGYRYCWLRRNPGGASNNNNRRGGFKARDFPKCDGTFGDMSGPQVGAMTVYGGSDAELDAECCNYCRKQSNCEFWVRDYRRTFPSNIGGKTCWLRRAPNFNSRSATHPHRRGGMKPKSLLQEEAEESEAKMNMLEEDREAPEVADPESQEMSLLQTAEGTQSSHRLWTISDADAKVDEHQEQQEVESQAKVQAEAEAKAQSQEQEVRQAEMAAEMKIADEQTEKVEREEKLSDFNSDIPKKVQQSGDSAAMDERGYQAVVNLRNNAEMEAYVRRACRYMGFVIRDGASLRGIVPHHSGVSNSQTFEDLLLELERNAHDADLDNRWIIPESEVALEEEAPEAPLEAES